MDPVDQMYVCLFMYLRPEGPVGSGLRSTAPICFWNSPRESLVPFLDIGAGVVVVVVVVVVG